MRAVRFQAPPDPIADDLTLWFRHPGPDLLLQVHEQLDPADLLQRCAWGLNLSLAWKSHEPKPSRDFQAVEPLGKRLGMKINLKTSETPGPLSCFDKADSLPAVDFFAQWRPPPLRLDLPMDRRGKAR